MQHRTTNHPTRNELSVLTTLAAALGIASITACAMLPLPARGGGGAQAVTTAHTTETREESHTINGQPVAATPAERTASAGAAFGATCYHNSDCASNTCFVGSGEIGYCTSMCDSFSDCPSFWECEKVGNAPQKICQQDAD